MRRELFDIYPAINMKLDNKQQQAFLLEMIRVANIPGAIIDLAASIKKAIEQAEIDE
jgi:hypothetical protein